MADGALKCFRTGCRYLAWSAREDPTIAYAPSAEALAYLRMIPQAVRLEASARANAEHWRTVCEWLGSGAVLAIIAKSKILSQAQQRLSTRASEGLVNALVCLLFMALFAILHLPILALKTCLWPTGETLAQTVAGALSDSLLIVPLQAAALFAGLSLARVWPKGWAAALAASSAVLIFLMIMIAPVTAAPQARHDVAAPAGAGRSLLEFVRRGGLRATSLDVFSSQDPVDVDMEGFMGVRRAALSQAALSHPTAQTYAAIGHLLGHYRHKDLLGLTMLGSGMASILFFALYFCERPLASALGEPRTAPVLQARSLAILVLIGWACLPVFTVAFNLFDQVINYRADAYAVSLTHDPDALCRWLIMIDAKTKADPSALEALFFYDHPPLARRLDNALHPRLLP